MKNKITLSQIFMFSLIILLGSSCDPEKNYKFTDLPKNVVAVLGEAESFETSSKTDSSVSAALDLSPILKKVKNVEDINLLIWDAKSAGYIPQAFSKEKDGFYTKLKPNSKYLVLGIVNQRALDTYRFFCRLHSSRKLVGYKKLPEICTKILCAGDVFKTDEMIETYPELGADENLIAMRGTSVGGLGGNMCEICTGLGQPTLEPVITPGIDCYPTRIPGFGGTFIFARKINASSFQIFKSENGVETNLSNNAFSDQFPDVSADGAKISYISSSRPAGQNGIYTMRIDGSEQTLEHPTEEVLNHTAWDGSRLVGFAEGNSHSKIMVIDVEGTIIPTTQGTFPNNQQKDKFGHDFLPSGKDLIYSRNNSQENDFDLWREDWNHASVPPVTRLTNTPNVSEELPVISHNGRLLAIRELVFAPGETLHPSERIRVFNVSAAQEVDFANPAHVINLPAPVGIGITGLDFTAADNGLLVSVVTTGVAAGASPFEIFFIRLDGTGLQRLTDNTLEDDDPRAIPGN